MQKKRRCYFPGDRSLHGCADSTQSPTQPQSGLLHLDKKLQSMNFLSCSEEGEFRFKIYLKKSPNTPSVPW